ncbi:MAG: cation transporter [Candidatus Symbiothrix sp.]|jgi:copper chaperone CopZ|nr:cation transporter [Candidatus Symbiothrix sp.]
MNKLIIICALLLGATGVVLAQKNSAKSEKITTVFDVQTMHGDHCKKRIEGNIAYEKGVKDLLVNLKENTVTVTYEPGKISETQLIEAFKKLGYTATPIAPKEEKVATPRAKESHHCCI